MLCGNGVRFVEITHRLAHLKTERAKLFFSAPVFRGVKVSTRVDEARFSVLERVSVLRV
jgi:hypothetical protein